MTLSARDRRLLPLLGVLAAVTLGILFWPDSKPTEVVGAFNDIPQAERRLSRVRILSGAVPARQESLKKVSAELASREKGLLSGETANQAQARLVEVVRRLLRSQTPPIDMRNLDLAQPKRLDANYGEVAATFTFSCRIEQLVNFLAELSAQPELLASQDLQINGASQKEKVMTVRASVAGLIPARLVPEKRGDLF